LERGGEPTPGRLTAAVAEEVFTRMLRIVEELQAGGCRIYGRRGERTVVLWCTPEDHPDGWAFEFPADSRVKVAVLRGVKYGGFVCLYLEVGNELRRARAADYFEAGLIDVREYLRQLGLSVEGTPEEWDWAEEKTYQLVEMAQGITEALQDPELWRCPLCGALVRSPTARRRVGHLIDVHGLTVLGVEIRWDGVYALTEGGLEFRL